MPTPIRPELYGDFLLLDRLPASGMADVFVAVRVGDRSGRTYVVKRPRIGERATGEAAQAILREAEVLGGVRAPPIVSLEAAGEIAGLPYIAIEHVRGASLDTILGRAGALSVEVTTAIARDLAGALAAVHEAGYVHGDVSPGNILVDEAGDVHVIDFGLASRIGARRDAIAGKPGYVAPEAVRPVRAHASEDIYGWGVVVAECLLGARLFKEEQLTQAAARPDEPLAPDALGAFQRLVAPALKRDPEARPSARALREQLEALAIDRGRLAVLAVDAARAHHAPSAAPGDDAAGRVAGRAKTWTDEPPLPLTPTAPMVVRATVPDVSAPPASAERVAPPAAASSVSIGAWRFVIALLALAGAVGIGVVLGRASMRARGATIAYSGPAPRRARVEVDGRPVTAGEGAEQPIGAGKHTLTVVFPKGERKDVTFHAHPGEHVLLVPLVRSLSNGEEDRPPP